VEERGIADDRHDLPRAFGPQRLLEPVGGPDGGAHADAQVHRVERGKRGQGVAADVPRDGHLQLLEGEEEPPVRAAGTQVRRAGRDGFLRAQRDRLPRDRLAHDARIELPEDRDPLLPLGGDPQRPDVRLEVRVELLDDHHAGHPGGEFPDQPLGQRVRQPNFQDRRLWERLLHVMVGDPGRHDPQRPVAPLDPVPLEGLRVLLERTGPLLDHRVTAFGVHREHHPLGGVALEPRRERRAGRLPRTDDALGVGDPGGGPQEERGVEPLGELERQPRVFLGLGRVGRLEHRDLGRERVVAVVLLVLGGMQLGIVRRDDDQPPPHTGVGNGEDRVGRHVHADVLHHRQRPDPRHGSADGDLDGDLLVRGPLGADPFVPDELLEDLRAGGPGVRGGHPDARLERSPGDRFVSGEKAHAFFICRDGHLRV
jgi:hypothetical protein